MISTHTTPTRNADCDGVVFTFTGTAMKKNYDKPHLTFENQVEQLQRRCLTIANPVEAINTLEKIGYYRLSAYWYPFRKMKPEERRTTPFNYRFDEFEPNHSFEQAVALYQFDERLRHLVLEALGVIEIQLRTKIAYYAGNIDRFIHLDRALLDQKQCSYIPKNQHKDSYAIWLSKYNKQLSRARSEDFIRHHQARYGQRVPIWIASEILDFGSVSKLFDFLPKTLKNQIAPSFGVLEGTVVSGWIRNFNYIRNIAAHHSRLWNRLIVTRIKAPNRNVVDPGIFHLADMDEPSPFRKVYPTLALIAYTLSFLDPQSDWRNRLISLIEDFPEIDGLGPQTMGFPSNWRELAIWRSNVTFLNGAAIPPWQRIRDH